MCAGTRVQIALTRSLLRICRPVKLVPGGRGLLCLLSAWNRPLGVFETTSKKRASCPKNTNNLSGAFGALLTSRLGRAAARQLVVCLQLFLFPGTSLFEFHAKLKGGISLFPWLIGKYVYFNCKRALRFFLFARFLFTLS